MICELPKCKRLATLTYLGHEICERHWNKHCDGIIDLRVKLRITDQQTLKDLGV